MAIRSCCMVSLSRTVTQPSVSMQWYLFRALERCGLYERTDALWEPWRHMLRENLTTCTESNTNPRSDCHAWGAHALHWRFGTRSMLDRIPEKPAEAPSVQ